MKSPEPVTALTDYLLAAAYLIFALRLTGKARAEGQVSLWLAAATFLATSAAAAAGGTYHLIGTQLLWKTTVYCLGLAGFCMTAAAAMMATRGGARQAALAAAGLQLAVFGVWVARDDDFRYVIYDYGAALLLTLALFGLASSRGLSRDTRWIAAAVVVTLAGSIVQASGFSLHRHFNHNDIYHVIQLGAAWLFYRGFRRVRDYR